MTGDKWVGPHLFWQVKVEHLSPSLWLQQPQGIQVFVPQWSTYEKQCTTIIFWREIRTATPRLRHYLNLYIETSLTFSPISVLSPAGNISMSAFSAQASIVVLYLESISGLPNSTFSWTVAFWIHACWATYPILPCVDRKTVFYLLCFHYKYLFIT